MSESSLPNDGSRHSRPDGGSQRRDGTSRRGRIPALNAHWGRHPGQPRDAWPALPAAYFDDARISDPGDSASDYRKTVLLLIKHRRLIFATAVTSLAIGLVYTLLQTPMYRASATIQINRQAANISGIAGLGDIEASTGNEFYQTQYEILKSRAVAQKTVSALNLADTPALYRRRPSGWAKLRQLVSRSGDGEVADIATRQAMAVAAVIDGLSVEPVRSSSIVRISFQSADAHVAQRVADGVAENFITSNIERNFAASAYARRFLEDRLQELRLKLEESERALVAYADRQDILTTASEQSLITVNLDETNQALAEAGKKRLADEVRWRQAEAAGGVALPQSLETAVLQDLRVQRNALSLSYEHKLKDFKPAYPEMVRLRARIEETERQIAAEVARIRSSLRTNYDAAVKEEQALARRMEELKADVMNYRNRNIRYTILQREVDTNRSLYEGLLQRYKEIGVAGGIDGKTAATNVSFVDHAQLPAAPYTPRLVRNLAGALVFGLMLGGAAAFGREFFDNSFNTPEDLEDGLALPLLGTIPLDRSGGRTGNPLDDRRSPQDEAYRSLRAALQFATAAGPPRSIVVTSALEAEGKSTAAVHVAAQFARIGLSVLIIDADMRKPSLHNLLGCHGEVGLSQYLAGGSAPPEALQATSLPGLTLLASGPVSANPAELLSGAMMAWLISAGTEQFDLVVVDAPPVAGLADTPLIASVCRATLLVVEANRTHRRAVMAAVKRLRFARAEIIGAVLNKFDVRHSGYAYGYGTSGFYGQGPEAQKCLTGTVSG